MSKVSLVELRRLRNEASTPVEKAIYAVGVAIAERLEEVQQTISSVDMSVDSVESAVKKLRRERDV